MKILKTITIVILLLISGTVFADDCSVFKNLAINGPRTAALEIETNRYFILSEEVLRESECHPTGKVCVLKETIDDCGKITQEQDLDKDNEADRIQIWNPEKVLNEYNKWQIVFVAGETIELKQ